MFITLLLARTASSYLPLPPVDVVTQLLLAHLERFVARRVRRHLNKEQRGGVAQPAHRLSTKNAMDLTKGHIKAELRRREGEAAA